MCGIAGFIRNDLGEQEKKRITRSMLAQLRHRGPDGWGTYINPDVALGHTRLSIIDLQGGAQPMCRGRYTIAYNGEVFNYLELRAELEGCGQTFLTQSDTEVVLACFEVYGLEAFKKFNGQFALLIWDEWNKKLYAARDRYGIRPLYVLRHQGNIYFSSEMKAFDVLPGYERKYNIDNLFEHALAWNTLNTNTVYQNIESLMPGTVEVYSTQGRVERKRYYTLGESGQDFSGGYEQAKDQLYSLLNEAVSLRLRSDVAVGCYLSGGVDSSIIAHLASENIRHTLKTYSVSFSDAQYDESEFQQKMSRKVGSQHYDLKVDAEMINDGFMNSIYHLERPVFRTAPVPLSLLSGRVNQDDIKVVLTGEAADEILFGYDSYKEVKLLEFWNKNPESKYRPLLIKKLYPHLKHYADEKQYGLMKMYYEGFLGGGGISGLNIRLHNNRIIKNYLHKDNQPKAGDEDFFEQFRAMLPSAYEGWSVYRQQQFMEMNTLLSGYLLSSQGDRMSMSNSVEGRYPFLDHHLVEFAFSLPDKYKLKAFSQKHILRDAFKHVVPEEIINRPKLPYQAPDLKSFFRDGKLFGVAEHFLSPEVVSEYGVFDPKLVQRLLKKYEMRKPDQIGYRDNMVIVFMLSAHIALHGAKNIRQDDLSMEDCNVDVSNFNTTAVCH